MAIANLLAQLAAGTADEQSTVLVETADLRIERIVSRGHASPAGFWYDQPEHEWVLLIKGAARLRFEDDESLLEMAAGDFVDIPAHRRHRVEWTTPAEPTIWLAVHYRVKG